MTSFNSLRYIGLIICITCISQIGCSQSSVKSKNSDSSIERSAKADEYFAQGLFAKALVEYHRDLKQADLSRDAKSHINNQLSLIFLERGDIVRALEQAEMSIEYEKELSTAIKAEVYSTIGTIYEKQGEYMKALSHQKKSLFHYESMGDSLSIARVYENIGSVYEDLTQYDLALSYFEKAEGFLPANALPLANLYNNIGDIYRKTESYTTSEEYYIRALQMAEHYDLIQEKESVHNDLAKLFAAKGQHDRAYSSLREAHKFQEVSLNRVSAEKLEALKTDFDNSRMEHQIKLLEAEKRISRARSYILGLLSIILLGVLIFGYRIMIKKKRRLVLQKDQEIKRRNIEERQLQNQVKLKEDELTKYAISVSGKNKMLEEVNNKIKILLKKEPYTYPKALKNLTKQIDIHMTESEDRDTIFTQFDESYPQFMESLHRVLIKPLSKSERRLAVLLKLNLSSKEIASVLHIAPDSVRIARYRLRKKLPLDSQEDLSLYLNNL